MKLAMVAARITAFLVISDTINFNLYYRQTVDIVDGHLAMQEEYERKRNEEEGHPDDIYLLKPEDNRD